MSHGRRETWDLKSLSLYLSLSGSPSAPRFDLINTPPLEGTEVTIIWLPSENTGGDDQLYYDVYTAKLDASNPAYCRQNEEGIGIHISTGNHT